MKISCNMAEDLLPLYLEDSCSPDSQGAVEEHLEECPACRERFSRMKQSIIPGAPGETPEETAAPRLADYARRIRRRRIRLFALTVAVILAATATLSICYLAVVDMRRQAAPHVFQVEPGTYNLTGCDLAAAAEDAGKFVLYTNSQQIRVEVQSVGEFQGTVLLWLAENDDSFIQTADVSGRNAVCTFQNLSAANRYRVTCPGLDGASVIIGEGREVSFWHSLGSVLREIMGR